MGPRGSLGDNKNFFGQSGPYKFSAFKTPTATSGPGDGQKIFFVWGGEGGGNGLGAKQVLTWLGKCTTKLEISSCKHSYNFVELFWQC